MNVIHGIFREAYFLLNEMSPYLVFGFLVAGVIHIFLDEKTIAVHLGKNNFLSVIKASLFGIPLPLCSCGVLPAAFSLKKSGASKGSIVSFLVTTPTTGVDSILATYSLMGGIFTVFRVAATFVTGIIAGVITNIFHRHEPEEAKVEQESSCKTCHSHEHAHESHHHTFSDKIAGALRYAFVDLLEDVGPWLLIGIMIGGAIAYFVPEAFMEKYMGSVWQSMIIMLLVGTPMYVCASGSLPIAAALMLKGLNPGAAFVFLLVGPATNSAAVTVIAKELGFKTMVVFLVSIIICSLLFGFLLNVIWERLDMDVAFRLMQHNIGIPDWIRLGASVLLLGGILLDILIKKEAHH